MQILRHSHVAIGLAVFLTCHLAVAAELPKEAGVAEAVAVGNALDHGCMAYELGERSETQVVRDLHLVRGPMLHTMFEGAPPRWRRYVSQDHFVELWIDGGTCDVHAKGRDPEADLQAAHATLARRLGSDFVHRTNQAGPLMPPGAEVFCLNHTWFSYSPPRRELGSVFEFQVSQGLCRS